VKELPKLGTREDERLEFKQAESLRTHKGRRHLLNEIVGMLNSGKGGRILVGVTEQQGALTGLDPLQPDERTLSSKLHDAIVDGIEPRVREDDCRTEWIETPGGLVLELRIPQRGRPARPYCLREGDSRLYKIRVQDRLRTMSFEELMPPSAGSPSHAESWFSKHWNRIRADSKWLDVNQRPSYLLVFGVQRFDGQKTVPLPENAVELVNRPPEHLARPQGWTFQTSFPGSAKWRGGKSILQSGDKDRSYRQMRVEDEGVLAYGGRLEHLQWDNPERWQAEHPQAPGMIYPLTLVESVVSVLRLARELWTPHLADADVHAQMLLTGTKGWLLPPYRPGTVGYLFVKDWHAQETEEVESSPQRIPGSSFAENPDALAWDLLVDLYQGFDYEPECIPWFDVKEKRFVPR